MTALLTLENVSAGYGEAIVLNGISLSIQAGETLALLGRNGTGKTTLIKEICKQLGSTDNFSSPTYSIVNQYAAKEKIYHIDLYRLKNFDEALAIGIEEYIIGDNYCFIEWPELIERILPDDIVKIEMKPDGNLRNLSIFRN